MGLTQPPTPDETVLVLRAQRGERDAFDALVAMHQRRAYQFAMRLCGNPDDAADLVAEAFIRAYRAIGQFRSAASFSTWLFRILSNVYLDVHRKEKSHPHVSIQDTLDAEDGEVQRQFPDPSAGPEELAEGAERATALLRAIRRLPEIHRVMILLYHTEGKSYEEIAAIVGLPLGTVKSRMNRARLNLRSILEKQVELFGT
jgi:RNA polymerase sigma-70 factor (ECF subfamily)